MAKNLILYYSRKGQNYVNGSIANLKKGNAEICAEFIQKAVDGDLFEIETVKSYSTDYTTKSAKVGKGLLLFPMTELNLPLIPGIWTARKNPPGKPYKEQFGRENLSGQGAPNTAFAQYFVGNSWLNPLVDPKRSSLFLANVAFEPGYPYRDAVHIILLKIFSSECHVLPVCVVL